MQASEIKYSVDGQSFTGFLFDGSKGRKVPGIVVAHEGGGMTEHPKQRARMLADLGYVAFAMDTFGETVSGMDRAMAIIRELSGDLPRLRRRANAALDIVKKEGNVDAKRTGAIGFCFGGTTVLELARSGAEVNAIVSFHGGLATTAPQDAKNIKGKVLACHGAEDPIITPEMVEGFLAEMRAAKVDFQFVSYGNAGHSFTNREVDAMNMPGFKYDEQTDKRSWQAMRNFFDEVLGPV
jgi:dienelactone hydrolase